MKSIHWFEKKQLDRVTNYSTETEIISTALKCGINFQYYCSFSKLKEYYGLEDNINYLGRLKNRYLKFVEFNVLILIKMIQLVVFNRDIIIMVNQDLIKHTILPLKINTILGHKNKFIVDIRTTPTIPETFEQDMKKFHNKFKYAIKNFHGFSFITPFMEKYVMDKYDKDYTAVNWSSGVDIDLFDPINYDINEIGNKFKIFYHGGISESRGNLHLIKACENLVQNGFNIELRQIGILVDIDIRNYIHKNNLEGWCKLLDPVSIDKIPKMIAESDLPVLPFPNFMAWRVSSPIKLMEYLAMGKKVLAPDMESFTDVFGVESDMIFYYNSKASDPVSTMENKIRKIIENDLLSAYKPSNCRDFVASRFTWENQAKILLQYCQTL